MTKSLFLFSCMLFSCVSILSAQNTLPATGNVGIGTSTLTELFNVGTSSAFRVNSSGSIVAATGITTSGQLKLLSTPTSDPNGLQSPLLTYGTAGQVMKITPSFVSTDPTVGNYSPGYTGNVNDISSTSVGYLSSTATNLPVGSPGGIWTASAGPLTSQIVMSRSGSSLYWRGLNAGNWGPWFGVTLNGNLATTGGNSITLTSTGATNVTLPTTGTLTTLNGQETLTNKNLAAPEISAVGGSSTVQYTNTTANWITGSTGSSFVFGTGVNLSSNPLMTLLSNGNVGIGKNNPTEKLAVNGTIHAKAVQVDLNNWSDYVFSKQYKLRPLSDVKSFIEKRGHLPEVPSEAEIIKDGLNVGEMNKLLLKKVEELTLYLIEQNKLLEEQSRRIKVLEELRTK